MCHTHVGVLSFLHLLEPTDDFVVEIELKVGHFVINELLHGLLDVLDHFGTGTARRACVSVNGGQLVLFELFELNRHASEVLALLLPFLGVLLHLFLHESVHLSKGFLRNYLLLVHLLE